MINENNRTNLIMSDIIRGRCRLKDVLLCFNEYDGILPDGYRFHNIIHCELRNIEDTSALREHKNAIAISFDLLIIYESLDMNNVRQYHFYTERLKKSIELNKKSYTMYKNGINMSNLKCRNFIRNINYSTDIDLTCTKVTVNITASIESLLLDMDVIQLENLEANNADVPQAHTQENIPIEIIQETTSEGDLSHYINQLSILLKKTSQISEVNKMLEEENTSKDTRLNYLEYKYSQANSECNSLRSSLEDKTASLTELKSKLEKLEKRVSILQSANLVMNQEVQTLQKENFELKALIEEEENKKKKQLNYRIKSVFNKLI